jgi:maltose alpha-D-glucosyltransferase/alpha-amylase
VERRRRPVPEARIIFVDTEVSNWTFDPVAEQYYWHRFFSHQPDLNFDNPAVQEAMFDVVRFWLDLGIDGFRLDAVPYLFERGRHERREPPRDPRLPRRLRAMVDEEFPAGCCSPRPTSGPPTSSTTSATAGGDECHMCFHFPLMPRMFMALRREGGSRSSTSSRDARPSPTGRSGASSCATTTS